MDAQTVIESYVRDVTAKLPMRDRSDVATELRALLSEELAARAAGRTPDEAMAVELVRGFGSPAQAAERYRPASPPLLEGADTRPFLTWAIVGGLALATLAQLTQPHATRDAVTNALLAWLGLLLVVFALRNWARRHWPALRAWRPRDPDRANRFGSLMLVAGIALGVTCYGAPRWVFATFSGGGRLTVMFDYAPQFQAMRLPWLLGLWGIMPLVYAWLAVEGRWRPLTRRVEAILSLSVGLVLGWFLVAGPMFIAASVDRAVKTWLVLITAGLLADAALKIGRAWPRNAPPRGRPGATLAV
jgi:hypothetical protein